MPTLPLPHTMKCLFAFPLFVSIFVPNHDICAFSFVLSIQRLHSSLALLSAVTIQELKEDPFMNQVSHAAELCERLSTDDNHDEQLYSLLMAQLSHSDGIRGFFVQYLTTYESSNDTLPQPLQRALTELLSSSPPQNDLLSLACMNVIMPTAMSTMHTETGLQQSSLRTAQRGIQVLQFLATVQPSNVTRMVRNIVNAARVEGDDTSESVSPRDDEDDVKDVAYWNTFYDGYGYGPLERENIALTMSTLLKK